MLIIFIAHKIISTYCVCFLICSFSVSIRMCFGKALASINICEWMSEWIREEIGSLWQRLECQISLGLEPGALVFSSAIYSFMEEATCRLGWEREEDFLFFKLEHLLKETDIMWSQRVMKGMACLGVWTSPVYRKRSVCWRHPWDHMGDVIIIMQKLSLLTVCQAVQSSLHRLIHLLFPMVL